MNISQFIGAVTNILEDDVPILTTGLVQVYVEEAIDEFSHFFPLEKVSLMIASTAYGYSLPSDWMDEFSAVCEVVYPVDETSSRISVIDPDYYTTRMNSTGTMVLRFMGTKPSDGEYFCLHYTTPHIVTTATSTIPTYHDDAIKCLAAARCSFAIARSYSKDIDNSLALAGSNYRDKAMRYNENGKLLMRIWEKHIERCRSRESSLHYITYAAGDRTLEGGGIVF